MNLFSITLVLFLIMDPLGNVKNFITYVENLDERRQKVVIFREMCIALAFILFFNFIGDYLFDFLKISNIAVYLSSAIILFLGAIKILFPKTNHLELKITEEPLLVPLAIPMIAGPALLATVMLYASTEQSTATMVTAILIAWAISSVILYFSKEIIKTIGPSALTACEKLMGMVLVLLAIQRFLQGIILFNAEVS